MAYKNHEDWLLWARDRYGKRVYISMDLMYALAAGAHAIEVMRHVPIEQRMRAENKMETERSGERANRE